MTGSGGGAGAPALLATAIALCCLLAAAHATTRGVPRSSGAEDGAGVGGSRGRGSRRFSMAELDGSMAAQLGSDTAPQGEVVGWETAGSRRQRPAAAEAASGAERTTLERGSARRRGGRAEAPSKGRQQQQEAVASFEAAPRGRSHRPAVDQWAGATGQRPSTEALEWGRQAAGAGRNRPTAERRSGAEDFDHQVASASINRPRKQLAIESDDGSVERSQSEQAEGAGDGGAPRRAVARSELQTRRSGARRAPQNSIGGGTEAPSRVPSRGPRRGGSHQGQPVTPRTTEPTLPGGIRESDNYPEEFKKALRDGTITISQSVSTTPAAFETTRRLEGGATSRGGAGASRAREDTAERPSSRSRGAPRVSRVEVITSSSEGRSSRRGGRRQGQPPVTAAPAVVSSRRRESSSSSRRRGDGGTTATPAIAPPDVTPSGPAVDASTPATPAPSAAPSVVTPTTARQEVIESSTKAPPAFMEITKTADSLNGIERTTPATLIDKATSLPEAVPSTVSPRGIVGRPSSGRRGEGSRSPQRSRAEGGSSRGSEAAEATRATDRDSRRRGRGQRLNGTPAQGEQFPSRSPGAQRGSRRGELPPSTAAPSAGRGRAEHSRGRNFQRTRTTESPAAGLITKASEPLVTVTSVGSSPGDYFFKGSPESQTEPSPRDETRRKLAALTHAKKPSSAKIPSGKKIGDVASRAGPKTAIDDSAAKENSVAGSLGNKVPLQLPAPGSRKPFTRSQSGDGKQASVVPQRKQQQQLRGGAEATVRSGSSTASPAYVPTVPSLLSAGTIPRVSNKQAATPVRRHGKQLVART